MDQLVTFLQHQQREEAAGPALALSLIERYEPSETGEGLARDTGLRPERRELQGWGYPGQPQAPWLVSACSMKADRREMGLQHHYSLSGSFEDPAPRK